MSLMQSVLLSINYAILSSFSNEIKESIANYFCALDSLRLKAKINIREIPRYNVQHACTTAGSVPKINECTKSVALGIPRLSGYFSIKNSTVSYAAKDSCGTNSLVSRTANFSRCSTIP